MPCPLFEPQRRVSPASEGTARLPLIFEFEGLCHAGNQSIDALHSFRYCYHGNAEGHCDNLPGSPLSGSALPSSLRFDVTARTESMLSVLVVQERNYWPLAWSRVEFLIEDGRIMPEIEDVCRRAQVFHFCRSYLEKFYLEKF